MRSGFRFFAVCGVVGLALNVSTAADYPTGYDDMSANPPATPRNVQHMSRDEVEWDQPAPSAAKARPKTLGALEEEYSRAGDGKPAARNARKPAAQPTNTRTTAQAGNGLSGVRNYREELFGQQAKPAAQPRATAAATQRIVVRDPQVQPAAPGSQTEQDADLIHAEYQRSRAKATGEIRQVQGYEGYDVHNSPPPAPPTDTTGQEFDFGAGSNSHGTPESHYAPESHNSPESGTTGFAPETGSDQHEPEQGLPQTRLRILPSGPAQTPARTELFERHEPAAPYQPSIETHASEPQGVESRTPQTRTIETRITESRASEMTQDAAPAVQAPNVTVRWVKEGEIRVGQECALGLVVKNTGETVANGLEIDAMFPQTCQLISAEPQPTAATEHLSWAMASLQPGEEQTIHIKLIPSQRGDLEAACQVRFTGAAASVFQVEEPMLHMDVKGPEEVMAGDLASQTVVVSNPGTGTATNVIIEAHVPEGLEHPRGERLMMEIGSLAPGEQRMVRLPLAAVKGGTQSVSIEARADAGLTQSLTREIHVISPSIKVAIEGPGLRYIGRNADYVVTVTNDGSGATNNVRVMHQLPQGFKFISAEKGGTFEATQNMVTWFVGSLEAGESARLNVECAATEPGNFAHHVSAVSEQGARSAADFQTQVEGTASLVLEIVDLADPIEVGAETAYEVRVRNEGTAAAGNVGVSCELPTAIQLVGAKGPSEHIVESGVIVFKALDRLEPGKTAVYRVGVIGKVPGNHRFRARLVSDSNAEPLIFEELTKFYGDPIPGSERPAMPPTAYRR